MKAGRQELRGVVGEGRRKLCVDEKKSLGMAISTGGYDLVRRQTRNPQGYGCALLFTGEEEHEDLYSTSYTNLNRAPEAKKNQIADYTKGIVLV